LSAPRQVVELVERFERNRSAYLSPAYNEEDVRNEFIDPLFKALKWDVQNKRGFAEPYKDVVREHGIRITGGVKAPDYTFRIGGTRKFFVEAKKPAVRIKTEPEGAFQLRRYAWSAKLPLSVLTSFGELAVYDCRVEPDKRDRASTARVLFMSSEEYPERWSEIADIFSRNAVLLGSFDAFAEGMKGKRGTAEVDDAFLAEMESWRELLARHLALRNPSLSETELNFAVQQTIDRIVFLRICEDRGIERYGQLLELLEGENVYRRLCELFRRADDRFNSGLFHFRYEKGRREAPDSLTLRMTVEDKPLKDMIRRLYYPDSPYEFRVISADILGQVYEQFLGQVITLTPAHRARVEDKPEVKRAGGVYYTPTHVVDYIVTNTLGKLLDGKSPRQAAKLRILDPACGSGSFLIAAYQYLIDWHLQRYVQDSPAKHARELYQGPGGEWKLSSKERRRILLDNIFGVDIDSQAVEVTKLSLLLKLLEGESDETLQEQFHTFKERALPDLAENIKCGNSLIGTDIQTTLFDEENERINAFDWDREFRDIMQSGGFDVVLGNPPYDVLEKERGKTSWPHTALSKYVRTTPEYEPALGGKLNLFRFFIVRSLNLTKIGGRYGMIVPLALLADISCARTRRHLMLTAKELVADCFPQKDNPRRRIFRKAKLSTAVVTCERAARVQARSARIQVRLYPWNSFTDDRRECTVRLADASLLDPENTPIALTDAKNWRLCRAVHADPRVARLGDMEEFSVTRGEINQTVYRRYIKADASMARLLKGVEVGRYHINEELSQGEREWFNERSFLLTHSRKSIIEEQRIATQRITGVDERRRLVATIIDPPMYFADSTNSIRQTQPSPYRLEYLVGLLNSTLFQWRFKITSTNNNVGTNELAALPIRKVDFEDAVDRARHDRMVALVHRMMRLHGQLERTKVAHERTTIERSIWATDSEIDALVYDLYDLAAKDVSIVERLEELPALSA
jgi:Alw26I/Eco31I/Esp3I family type II restriction m6 adenine DNA methyltransferase